MNLDELTIVAIPWDTDDSGRHAVALPTLSKGLPPAPLDLWDLLLAALLCVGLVVFIGAAARQAQLWHLHDELSAALDTIHHNQLTHLSKRLCFTSDAASLMPSPPEGMSVHVVTGAWAERADYFAEVCMQGRCLARTSEGLLGAPTHRPLTEPNDSDELFRWGSVE